jgi:hypothetical protein
MRTRDVVIFLTAVSAAVTVWYFRPALERRKLAAVDPDEQVVFGPDWHKPAHPWSQVESAQISRRDGLKACHEERWMDCWRLLRMSVADDPRLESDPEVVAGMDRVVEEAKKASANYEEEHPGM